MGALVGPLTQGAAQGLLQAEQIKQGREQLQRQKQQDEQSAIMNALRLRIMQEQLQPPNPNANDPLIETFEKQFPGKFGELKGKGLSAAQILNMAMKLRDEERRAQERETLSAADRARLGQGAERIGIARERLGLQREGLEQRKESDKDRKRRSEQRQVLSARRGTLRDLRITLEKQLKEAKGGVLRLPATVLEALGLKAPPSGLVTKKQIRDRLAKIPNEIQSIDEQLLRLGEEVGLDAPVPSLDEDKAFFQGGD